MKKLLFVHWIALGGMALLASCDETNIEGIWLEPVPGLEGMKQGFVLEAGGKASSVNMATLQYETWEKSGSRLILSGKSIGNHQAISFSDTLTIELLTADSMKLSKGSRVLAYARTDQLQSVETVPDAVLTPAKEVLTVKGELVIGHEVRSFTTEGDSVSYWVVDKTGELCPKYDEVTQGNKNGIPVYAELEVVDMGKSDEGFAAEYDGVYHVVKVKQISKK